MNSSTVLFLSLALLLLTTNMLVAQQTLRGTITDEFGEPIIGGYIKVYQGDAFLTGSATDFDGNYRISLDAGKYAIEFSYVGYDNYRIQGVVVIAGDQNQLDCQLTLPALNFPPCIGGYKTRPLDVDETTQGMILRSDEIRRVSKPN